MGRHFGVVQRPAIHAGWGARFHSAAVKPEIHELLGDAHGSPLTRSSAAELLLANVHQAIQEGAVGQHNGLATNGEPEARLDPDAAALFDQDADHLVLPEV